MSLSLLIEMASAGHADRIALGRGSAAVTFAELSGLVAGGGAVLGARAAGTAVLLARNGPILPHLLFAAAHAGIPFVPLNYRLSAERIHELLADLVGPVVVADDDYLPIVAGRAPAMSVAQFVAAARAAAGSAGPAAPVDDSAPAVVLFTSGTSATSKAVPLRHENLMSYVFATVEFGGAGADEAALVTVPPYHIAAIGSALSNLYSGRRVVHLPDFDPSAWLSLVREERVTTAMLVPTMLHRIVERLAGAPAEVPSLRLISYGGARMPQPVLLAAMAAFPACDFVNAYGLTETSSTIALLGPEDHRAAAAAEDPRIRARLSSVGRAVPGIEMQIRDANGQVLPAGRSGELWVRGAQVSGQYSGLGSVLDADGWFPTRDRASFDADGYLFIEGRSDDTIIRGGENIAPAEIEDVLLGHPDILDAAVVGVEDDEWGQRLVAAVVARDGSTVEETAIKQYVRAHLRGSRTPDEVVFLGELPHTHTGKLSRREVARTVAGWLAGTPEQLSRGR
ncbi:class I adenylate-forming enzyme family protein [Dactylosporangium sp. CA-092794]|uniref:class I adenylate-forming enzyme family protein n=1 Tax=Dactylosporangium sp. CA-092794 TaxID=3239929 RepID=UPI003D8A28B7